jgi:magnesium transporter
MSDVNIILYDPASKSARSGGLELLDEWDSLPDSWVWVNISGVEDETEFHLLNERFGVHHLAIQDAQRDRHPPKLEIFDDFVFIILRDLISEGETHRQRISQLSLFVGTNYLVTRHIHQVPAVESVLDSVQAQPTRLDKGPAHLLYLLCRRISDNYAPVVLELEERLAELEDLVFERPGDDLIELITRFNRSLKRLRRYLAYQHDVMEQLCKPPDEMPVELNPHEFNDVFENMERLASLCQLNQELAVDLLNTHFSLASHRLNQVMQILTITTVIFLPLALLAGIYGMNFQFMPELSWHFGYFGVLGAMAAIAGGLAVLFKRKGWL